MPISFRNFALCSVDRMNSFAPSALLQLETTTEGHDPTGRCDCFHATQTEFTVCNSARCAIRYWVSRRKRSDRSPDASCPSSDCVHATSPHAAARGRARIWRRVINPSPCLDGTRRGCPAVKQDTSGSRLPPSHAAESRPPEAPVDRSSFAPVRAGGGPSYRRARLPR